jgi:hypothetical protein
MVIEEVAAVRQWLQSGVVSRTSSGPRSRRPSLA